MGLEIRKRRYHPAIVSVVCLLGAAMAAHADVADGRRPRRESNRPHPSVVQVLVPEVGAFSRGSGTLIHIDGDYGYVITNWHVVRGSQGKVVVVFPDGHQSLARILNTDETWDLALLMIWRGPTQPMPLAGLGAKPGQDLLIAGYGPEGKYRMIGGQFTTFAAPEADKPYEMFEVSVAARQGDSGGPVVNRRGELVGVLFGAGDGRTTATQIGRVRTFVNQTFESLRQAETPAASIASKPNDRLLAKNTAAVPSSAELPQEYRPPAPPEIESPPADVASDANHQLVEATPPQLEQDTPLSPPQDEQQLASSEASPHWASSGEVTTPTAAIGDHLPASHGPIFDMGAQSLPGGITWDQLKSIFAAIGVFATLNAFAQTLFWRRKAK